MKFEPLSHLVRAGIGVAFVFHPWPNCCLCGVSSHIFRSSSSTTEWVTGSLWFCPTWEMSQLPEFLPGCSRNSSVKTTISYAGFLPAPLFPLLLGSKSDWCISTPFHIPHLLPGRGDNDQKNSKKAAAGGRSQNTGPGSQPWSWAFISAPCSLVARASYGEGICRCRTLRSHTKTQ